MSSEAIIALRMGLVTAALTGIVYPLAVTAVAQTAFHDAAAGSFVPQLTRKAFEKFGFSAATLIMDWPTIVGGEIAYYTQPERLKWPRVADEASLRRVHPV